jgi:uncharacterized protein YggU (UPF0235/DUF167 family)
VIAISPHPGGAVLPVLAHAGARRNAILGERAGALRVAVTAPPERGKANEAIQTLLAQSLSVKSSQISLISGATSRQKRFLVERIDPEVLKCRLRALVPEQDAASP